MISATAVHFGLTRSQKKHKDLRKICKLVIDKMNSKDGLTEIMGNRGASLLTIKLLLKM